MQGHMGKYQVGQEAERTGENVNTSLYSGFYRLWENCSGADGLSLVFWYLVLGD